MIELKFKRHWFYFYVLLTCGLLLLIEVATLLFVLAVNSFHSDSTVLKSLFLFACALALFTLAAYTVVQFFRATPHITISGKNIKIGNKKYGFDEIDNVVLFSKLEFPWIITYPMIGSTIKFKNGDTVNVFHKMYMHSWRLKIFFKQVFIDKVKYVESVYEKVNRRIIAASTFETYRGGLMTFSDATNVGILIMLFFIPLYGNGAPVIFFTITGTLWALYTISLSHYIVANDQYLVVRNRFIPWINYNYAIKDIKEIVYVQPWRQPYFCLQVITNNYIEKKYPVSAMSYKQWEQLVKDLNANGVSTRNKWELPKH